jgi:hypothetical protein
MDPREKARTKFHFHRPGVDAFNTAKIGQGKNQKPQVTHVLLKFTSKFRIRIRIGSGFNRVSGSGSRRAKMTHKKVVLDVLF